MTVKYAARTEMRPKFETARSPEGRLVHRVRSLSGYWRDGKLTAVYATWECGRTSPMAPVPVDGPSTCCACDRAVGVHP